MTVLPNGDASPHAPNARALLAAQNREAVLAVIARMRTQGLVPTLVAIAEATGLPYKSVYHVASSLIDAGVIPECRRSFSKQRGLLGETPEERAEIAARKAALDAERAERLRNHPNGSHETVKSPRVHRFRGPKLPLASDRIFDLYEPEGGEQ